MATVYRTDIYYPLTFAVRVIRAVIGFIEGAFVLRILLRLLGASPASAFVAWVYAATDRLLGPFAGALPAFVIADNAVIEFSVILAMIGYSFLGWLIIRLLEFMFAPPAMSIDYSEQRDVPL